jgi:DNA-binding CsgD family transcriptional regulator
MLALSSIDTQKLHQGIQQLYGLNHYETFGVDVLSIVHQLVPSDVPIFQQTDTRTCAVTTTFLPDSGWDSPENLMLIRDVLPRHLEEHPILQNMPYTLNGVYKISDFLSVAALDQREGIYQQFLQPLAIEDQMQFFLPVAQPGDWQQLAATNTVQAGFILNRGERSFTERDRLILNLLRPHLFQAYQNTQKYAQVSQALGQLQRSVNHLGLVSLNRDGQVQWATAQATIWLETYFAKPTCTGYLPDDLQLWVRGHLRGATNGSLNVERACEKLVIRLTIDPVGSHYTLMLEEQRRSNFQSLERLGLSQRETEVLGWLMQGKNNKAIATHMDVSASTIRKHLENIYRKLGVQNRTEAVSAALAQLALL